MENQGKRLLLAVGLALGVMLVWNLAFPPKKDEPKKQDAGSGSAVVKGSAPAVAPTLAVMPEVPGKEPQAIVLDFPGKVKATFSSFGGALVSWQLADHKYRKDKSTQNMGELLPGLTRPGTGAFLVDFTTNDNGVRKAPAIRIPNQNDWQGTKVSDTQVTYTLKTPDVDVEKTFTVDPDAYSVKMGVKITVRAPAGTVGMQSLAVSAFGYQDPKADLEGGTQIAARAWSSATDVAGTVRSTNVKDLAAAARWEKNIRWAGYDHPYMLQAYAPRLEGTETADKFAYAIGIEGVMRTDIVFPMQKIEGTTELSREVVAYLGPKAYKRLEAAEAKAGFASGFTETIDFGWFGVIGKPLLWLLLQFYSFFGNWGLAIMLLTILVKGATLYWTTKSMRSMKAMAALAPQMKALQERYKDDRQRLQAETMALYKVHNVNPIAGCLPILLQMPIWIALYRMLSNAGELYMAPFIPGWIDDLTATDPYHILPIVLVATMFAQARMTPSTGTSGQQKMLQYGMPLMFGVMSFFFPSGLTLYIFTNTVLSALHSIYMNKFDKKSIALVADMKAKAEAADKAAAGAKGAAKGKPAAAKPVIDVEADEVEDGDDETSATPASAGAKPGMPGRQQRQKRKKRRR